MTDPANPFASPTGIHPALENYEPVDCTQVTAESFTLMGGYQGSGGFRPPQLEFASRIAACRALQKKKLADLQKFGMTSQPATVAASNSTPLIVLAIIFLWWVLK